MGSDMQVVALEVAGGRSERNAAINVARRALVRFDGVAARQIFADIAECYLRGKDKATILDFYSERP